MFNKPISLLTREQTAELLGLSPATLAVWATNQRYGLRMLKIGRLVRYRLEDIEAFLVSRDSELVAQSKTYAS